VSYEGPGRYRHYKGGEYEVLGLAVREESKGRTWQHAITEVIYRPLSPGSLLPGPLGQEFWSRQLDDFNQYVGPLTHGNEARGAVPRFEKIDA
jgi:hypothetical protein